MTDAALPRPIAPGKISGGFFLGGFAVGLALAVALLLVRNWSVVQADSDTSRQCERTKGAFSSAFSSGFDTDRCRCKQSSLDFSDSCNSMYITLL